jgi:hypothetical protein
MIGHANDVFDVAAICTPITLSHLWRIQKTVTK